MGPRMPLVYSIRGSLRYRSRVMEPGATVGEFSYSPTNRPSSARAKACVGTTLGRMPMTIPIGAFGPRLVPALQRRVRAQPESLRVRALSATLRVRDLAKSLDWYRDVLHVT